MRAIISWGVLIGDGRWELRLQPSRCHMWVPRGAKPIPVCHIPSVHGVMVFHLCFAFGSNEGGGGMSNGKGKYHLDRQKGKKAPTTAYP